ncbi:hypothetical protein EHO58_01585 [Leptospira selangorensis]|uniref:hypothetical protein n=1 Tax=Leptospira selangorensis TaxID=2484982 RepID=UPI0010830710|nr:hypothetical protein [Leptospira selangorensis]TGK10142.1 hypothetical protein EHO58_01585 [Leptospira selangorensis]
MNLDELAENIQKSIIQYNQLFVDILFQWKVNDKVITDLSNEFESALEKLFKIHLEEFKIVSKLWEKFYKDAIQNIQGLTMNERLYFFCLFERFDSCNSVNCRDKIYTKLLAKK